MAVEYIDAYNPFTILLLVNHNTAEIDRLLGGYDLDLLDGLVWLVSIPKLRTSWGL